MDLTWYKIETNEFHKNNASIFLMLCLIKYIFYKMNDNEFSSFTSLPGSTEHVLGKG